MRRTRLDLLCLCIVTTLALVVTAYARSDNQSSLKRKGVTMTLPLTSTAFTEGGPIPAQYTCDGTDISPPLKWSNVPPGTRSLALICDDPDAPAGTWVHWVLYGLPPTVTELSEGVPTTEATVNGAKQGLNDFRRIGYGGPCPPPGGPHRYFFKLYALDTALNLKARATKPELRRVMEGHILAEGQLMGTYKRK